MFRFSFAEEKPLSILCLGAHCDDIEIGVGGTLLKLIAEYNVVSVDWVVCASNEIRAGEAKQSAEEFLDGTNPKSIQINSWRDGYLPSVEAEIKDYFEELKKTIQPDVIFTHYRDDRHQDHRLVSNLTWNTWRDHFILEYEIPKYDGDLGTPNFFVPLSEHYIKRKNSNILDSFVSQKGKHWFDNETFMALPRLRGMESAVTYAEAFFARKLVFH